MLCNLKNESQEFRWPPYIPVDAGGLGNGTVEDVVVAFPFVPVYTTAGQKGVIARTGQNASAAHYCSKVSDQEVEDQERGEIPRNDHVSPKILAPEGIVMVEVWKYVPGSTKRILPGLAYSTVWNAAVCHRPCRPG